MEKGDLTLVTADPFEAQAAVAGSRHVVAGGVVHALTQLLAAIAEGPCWTLCRKDRGRVSAHSQRDAAMLSTY